jgi:aldehyde:ferredoxin oxidoreductase
LNRINHHADKEIFLARVVKILNIDLTQETYQIESTSAYSDFVGGRGINQRLLFDLVSPDVDPLDSENAIILGAGPLVGTLTPCASRLAVDFKNAVTGGVGSGNAGGHFAAEMRFAGIDHIVITGKSAHPVYLYIADGKVFFRPARDLWGQDTWKTDNQIRRREKEKALKTLSIGVAGENQVRFACIICDRGRAVGYGGSGAIFGQKNLKAIAIRGTQSVAVAHPRQFLRELERFNEETVANSQFVATHRRGGTLAAYLNPGENRPHAVRNMSRSFWPNTSISKVSRQNIDERFMLRRHSCFACPVYGSAIYEVKGLKCEGFQANSWRAFASNLDITDVESIMHLHALTNLHGLDGDHTSSIMAWAVECYQNGILSTKDTDGLELEWGQGETLVRLLENIVHRVGFGDILAQGLNEACRLVGRGSEKYALISKKNALMESSMLSHKAWALGIITSTRGGSHLRGAPAVEAQKIAPALSRKLYGIEDIQDPSAYADKAKLVIWYENYKGVIDMMGLCYLASMWMDVTLYQPDTIARFYNSITGEEVSAKDLMKAGDRLQNLETLFNILHAGFDRSDFKPPEKLTSTAVEQGRFKGQKLSLTQWDSMLDDYFDARKWDKETGWPCLPVLEDLGLTDMVRILEKNNLKLKSQRETAGRGL